MKPEATQTPDPVVPPPGLPRAPAGIDISVTGRCNLRCRYCYYADEMAGRKDLPAERWHAFFEEASGLGVRRMVISGGEAFVRPDVFELVDGIVANKMRYAFLSNGTLITPEVVEEFGKGRRRVRLDYIQVSIDGSKAEIHDQSRPPKSFARALAGLRRLKEAGMPVVVRVTINRTNVEDLPDIARLLLEDVGLEGFGTNEAEQMGSARCYGDSMVLTPAERSRAMELLTGLNDKYGGRISADAGPLALARHFKEIEDAIERGDEGLPDGGTLSSCGGVFTRMAVLHDGSMVPCNMLPTMTMGVIGVHSLADAWKNSPAINAVRYRRQVPLDSLAECRDCQYTSFCRGGCPASVMARYDRLIARDPLLCYRIHRNQEDPDAL